MSLFDYIRKRRRVFETDPLSASTSDESPSIQKRSYGGISGLSGEYESDSNGEQSLTRAHLDGAVYFNGELWDRKSARDKENGLTPEEQKALLKRISKEGGTDLNDADMRATFNKDGKPKDGISGADSINSARESMADRMRQEAEMQKQAQEDAEQEQGEMEPDMSKAGTHKEEPGTTDEKKVAQIAEKIADAIVSGKIDEIWKLLLPNYTDATTGQACVIDAAGDPSWGASTGLNVPTGAVDNLYLALKTADAPGFVEADAVAIAWDEAGDPTWYVQFDIWRGVATPT